MTIPETPVIEISMIPLTDLTPHPRNVRSTLGDVTELASSIASTGILEPLIVLPTDYHPDGDQHLVVAGHRRLAAAIEADLGVAPCIIRDLSEAEVIQAMLAENIQRADISPVDEAHAYQRLIDLDTDMYDISASVGRSSGHIKGRLALLALPDPVLDKVAAGEISLKAAANLTRWASNPTAMAIVAENAEAATWNSSMLAGRIRARIRAEAVEEVRADLESAETRVHNDYVHSDWVQSRTFACQLSAMPVDDDTRAAHATEPCHAIHLTAEIPVDVDVHDLTIDGIDVVQTPICTDTTRHPETFARPGQADVDPEEAARYAAREAERAAWGEADVARIEWWSAWIRRTKITVDPLIALVLGLEHPDTYEAFNLLGIEQPNDPGDDADYIGQQLAADGSVIDPASTGLLAIATAPIIQRLYRNANPMDTDVYVGLGRALLTRLIDDGYEPAPIETEWLNATTDEGDDAQ